MTRKSASTSPPATSSQRPSPTTTPSEHTETEEGWKWQLPADITYASFDALDTPRPWHITSLALAQQRQASQQQHPSSLPSAQTKTNPPSQTTTHPPSQTSGNTTPRSQPRSTTSSPLLPPTPSIRQQQKRPREEPHYPLTTYHPRPSSNNHRHHYTSSSSPSSNSSQPPPTAAHPSYNAALISDSNPTKISMQYYQATRQVNEYRLMFRVEERDGEVQRWKRRVIEVS